LFLAFDLNAVRSEPNLEKRAEKAMDNAYQAVEAARTAYNSGDDQTFVARLDEVRVSVELAKESLDATGKDPHRKPKSFKKVEQSTGGLLRKVDGLASSVGVSDRDRVVAVQKRIREIQDDLVLGILTKKK
jgi:hypothetical protein